MAITDLSKFTSNCRACGKLLDTFRVFYGDVYHAECEPPLLNPSLKLTAKPTPSLGCCRICGLVIPRGQPIVRLPPSDVVHRSCFQSRRGVEEVVDVAVAKKVVNAMPEPEVGDYVEWVAQRHHLFEEGVAYRVERVDFGSFTVSRDGEQVPGAWYWTNQFRIVPPPAETKFPQQNIEDANMRDDAPLMVGDWVMWMLPSGRTLRRGERYQVRDVIPKDTSRFQGFYIRHDDVATHNALWCFTDDFRRVAPGKPPEPPKDLTWAEARFVGLILE